MLSVAPPKPWMSCLVCLGMVSIVLALITTASDLFADKG
jgi:hypothetical protein